MLQDFAFHIVVLDVGHKNWIKRKQMTFFSSNYYSQMVVMGRKYGNYFTMMLSSIIS
jgi:protein associated with RNAse G/E